ncbi:MAG: hypothetical protein MJ217_02675 [Bacilli bacterium]|nr:hypothetical protein [Bacilli bacterium]
MGSRFGNKSNKIYHIFTYSLSIENINNTISLLEKAISFFRNQGLSSINNDVLLRKGIDKKYIAVAVDCYFIDRINVNFEKKEIADESVISLYKVNNKNLDILRKIGLPDIKISNFVDYDEQTVILLKKEQIEYLNEKVPYLIAMSAKNRQKIVIDKICATTIKNVRLGIKAPTNEPIIGVIDTLFNTSVYFNK